MLTIYGKQAYLIKYTILRHMTHSVSYIRHQSLHNIRYQTLAPHVDTKAYGESGEMAQIALFLQGDKYGPIVVTLCAY